MDTSSGIISGVPTDTGLFTFTADVDDLGSNLWDESVYDLHVEPTLLIPGDIDVSGEVDISDLVYLVDYMFIRAGPCSDGIDSEDLTGSSVLKAHQVKISLL